MTMQRTALLNESTIPDHVAALAAWTEAALDRLPRVPDDIAHFLRDHGIRGTQCLSTNCPIAKWLKHEVPELATNVELSVTPLIAEVAHLVEVDLPTVVTDFIVAFVSGDYEFLFDDEPSPVGRAVDSPTTLGEF
jgi:hypothetical protein